MILLTDLVQRVRTYIQDTKAPYRYPDKDVLNYINSGVIDIVSKRPDHFVYRPYLRADVLASSVYTEADLTATIPVRVTIPVQVVEPLSMYVAAHLELRDDEFASDSRVAALFSIYRYNLVGR